MKKLLIENLQELKSSFGAVGVKAEFESEGATLKEAEELKQLADNAELSFVLKIGGCEARRDLDDARKLDITRIVAPMIESEYAFEKFIKSVQGKFPSDAEFFINIETCTGFNALDDILNNDLSKNLTGIVFGRSDFAGSLKISDVDSEDIFEFVKKVSEKSARANKKFILGGGISLNSFSFIKKIPYLSGIETRKIIFNTQKLDKEMINKALEFEMRWIEYKQSFAPNVDDTARLAVLAARCCKP